LEKSNEIKLSVLVSYPTGPKGSYFWVEKNIKNKEKMRGKKQKKIKKKKKIYD
jgi:hypothetical protein